MVLLATSVPLRGEGLQTIGEFEVAAGETAAFSLSYAPSHQPLPPSPDPLQSLTATEAFWRDWSAHCHAPASGRRRSSAR